MRLLTVLLILQATFFPIPGDARRLNDRRCDELYIVGEGETLQTISVKCNDIFILDDNPQVNDTDDIGPGTILFIRQTDKRGRMEWI